MNYRRLLGVRDLYADAEGGRGVTIAVVDSGTPTCYLHGGFPDRRHCGASRDVFGHATEVSSILFGCHGICGLCENANALYVKALGDSGTGTVRSVSEGIMKAIDSDADLINLSLGFVRTEKCPKSIETACERAFDAGKTIICAAGNDGGPVNWPAALDTTICVGSIDEQERKTGFSSVGEVDFVAPGTNLDVRGIGGGIKRVSGTSYSAAVATGIAALLIRRVRAENEGKTNRSMVLSAMKALAHDIGDTGWDSMTGYGAISGRNHDRTVCMRTNDGFFDRILVGIRNFIGINSKGAENGKV